MVDAFGGARARLVVNELVTRVGLHRIYRVYLVGFGIYDTYRYLWLKGS